MLLTTFTVTGTPSFMRSRGPGDVPLYPMVLTMRLGANSTVTGAISRVKSVLATSCETGGASNDCSCWPSNRPLAATRPASWRKSRRCMSMRKRSCAHGTARPLAPRIRTVARFPNRVEALASASRFGDLRASRSGDEPLCLMLRSTSGFMIANGCPGPSIGRGISCTCARCHMDTDRCVQRSTTSCSPQLLRLD